jgi:hypothetical protein
MHLGQLPPQAVPENRRQQPPTTREKEVTFNQRGWSIFGDHRWSIFGCHFETLIEASSMQGLW